MDVFVLTSAVLLHVALGMRNQPIYFRDKQLRPSQNQDLCHPATCREPCHK
jgi:hypothetical protein